jgi:hypothetical protein
LAPCVAAIVDGTITVNVPSTVDAGGPQDVCQSASPSAITLTGATIGGGATLGTWSILNGNGTLSSTGPMANPAMVTFTPDVDFAGTVQLLLTTDAEGVCAVETDVRTIEVLERPDLILSGGDVFCYEFEVFDGALGDAVQVAGSATGGSWSVIESLPPGGFVLFDQFTTQPDTVTGGVPPLFVGSVEFGFQTDDPFGCGAASGSFVVTFTGPQPITTWTGAVSDNWFDSDNWTNCIPGAITDAVIPQLADPAVTPYPVISGFNAVCKKIDLEGTATLEITGNWQLEITQ